MMTLSELPLGWIHAIGFFVFVLCALPALGAFQSLRCKKPGPRIAAHALLFVLCFPATFCFESYCRAVNRSLPPPAYCLPVMRLPVVPFLLAAAAVLAAILVLRVRMDKTVKNTLTSYSICQGLDSLPAGVLFSSSDGVPLLFNNAMRSVCAAAFGHAVLDYAYLRRRIERAELSPGCSLERHAEGYYLRLPDGTVWDLREKELTFSEGRVTELIAFNVTELYLGNEELRERNARLAAVNAQIREYTRNLDAIVRDKEILAAKIRLHDDFGKAQLAIKSYLMQPDGSREQLLSVLKTPVFLFRGEAETEPAEDPFDLLNEAADAIGVQIAYDGALPPQHRDVTAVAIHECLTNTVKHASGTHLYVKSRCEDGVWTVELTNDGMPPAGPVSETGGLANLRQLAENHGVELFIRSAPAFMLTLRFRNGA